MFYVMDKHGLVPSFISVFKFFSLSSYQREEHCQVHSSLRRGGFHARAGTSSRDAAVGRRSVVLAGAALLAGLTTTTNFPAAAADVLVSDLARILSRGTRTRLENEVKAIEDASGLRVRVVTVDVGVVPDASVRTLLALDDPLKVVIVIDQRGGNILTVRIGDGVYATLPRTFWIELPNRFGNQFYVSDAGVDRAIIAAVEAIRICVQPGRSCAAVPGVSDDQLKVSVVCSAVAGVIAGAASRTGGKTLNIPFLLLFSPIWAIFLISFGLAPVLSRLEGVTHMEPALVGAVFLIVATGIWWWIPRGIGPPPDAPTKV